ncbi:MAG: 4Fe-4S binding protein [Spirochaetia bacterium]|nr:4Fe-4S binding protein [Spirochaetia bacterium]
MNRKGLLPNLFLITLAYFALGFVSILFANLAILCIALPFILLAKTNKKLWCQTYCPRASLLNAAGKKNNWRKNPAFITSGRLKRIMLWYFALNMLFITGSTVQVALGSMEAMPYIRLFIAIELFSLPQLISVQAPLFLIHLSYRFYGMMASTTILALALSRIYRPRIWCAVCPIGTLSDSALRLERRT